MATELLPLDAAFARLSSPQPTVVFGYWAIRGLAQPIRNLLAYAEIPYVEVAYGDGAAEEARWAADKPQLRGLGFDFPNLPFLARPDGARLTQSIAIMQHIARARPELQLLGATPAAADLCSLWTQQGVDFRASISAFCYGSEAAVPAGLADGASLAQFEAALGERAFVAGGDGPTVADFVVCEALAHLRAILAAKAGVPDALAPFPRLHALVARFEALPAVRAALAKAATLPWNGDTAQFR